MDVAQRLALDLHRTPSGCLEWAGGLNRGYGQFTLNAVHHKAHRAAWELAYGIIPDGLHVLHHCDDRACCETSPTEGYPEGHLFLGTNAENIADMIAKGRSHWQQKTHCPQGHEYTEANTYMNPTRVSRQCRTCHRQRARAIGPSGLSG